MTLSLGGINKVQDFPGHGNREGEGMVYPGMGETEGRKSDRRKDRSKSRKDPTSLGSSSSSGTSSDSDGESPSSSSSSGSGSYPSTSSSESNDSNSNESSSPLKRRNSRKSKRRSVTRKSRTGESHRVKLETSKASAKSKRSKLSTAESSIGSLTDPSRFRLLKKYLGRDPYSSRFTMSNLLKSVSLLLPEHKRYGFSVAGYNPVTKVEFITKLVATCKGEKVTASEALGLLPHFLKDPALLAIESQNPSSWEEAVAILLKSGKAGKEIADAQKKSFAFGKRTIIPQRVISLSLIKRCWQPTGPSLRKQRCTILFETCILCSLGKLMPTGKIFLSCRGQT